MPWTPASLSPAIWLDAADSSTITISSSRVSQWNDKSGNARHFSQATASSRPVVTASAINNLDAVYFDGVDRFLASSYTTRLTTFTVFFVAKVEADATKDNLTILTKGSYFATAQTDFPWSVSFANTGLTVSARLDSGNDFSNDVLVSSGVIDPNDVVAECQFNEGLVRVYCNGELRNEQSGVLAAANTRPWTLGRAAFENSGGVGKTALKGYVAELLVIPYIMTGEQQADLIAYARQKWGLGWPPGSSQLTGTVTDDAGQPAARTVRVYNRATGTLLGTTTSDAVTGAYEVLLASTDEVQRIVLDDAGGTLYNDIIDRVIPG